MTTVPFALRLLMIEVGAATHFYQQPPMFPKVVPEDKQVAPRTKSSDTVAA